MDEAQTQVNIISNSPLKQNPLYYSVVGRFYEKSNKNILAIKFAENILRWVPKNTHDYNKLITPEELEKVLIKEDFSILDFSGLVFNPLAREWRLSKEIKLVNYFCTARLN